MLPAFQRSISLGSKCAEWVSFCVCRFIFQKELGGGKGSRVGVDGPAGLVVTEARKVVQAKKSEILTTFPHSVTTQELKHQQSL
jgi:hypothetical protein